MTTTCTLFWRALCSRMFLLVFILLVWWNFALFYHASVFQPLLAIGAHLHTSPWYATHFAKCRASPKKARSDDAATEQCMGEARRRHRLAPAAARQTRAGTGHMLNVANSESHILNVKMATLMNSRRLPYACTALSRLALPSKSRAGLQSWQHQTLQA